MDMWCWNTWNLWIVAVCMYKCIFKWFKRYFNNWIIKSHVFQILLRECLRVWCINLEHETIKGCKLRAISVKKLFITSSISRKLIYSIPHGIVVLLLTILSTIIFALMEMWYILNIVPFWNVINKTYIFYASQDFR